MEHIPDISFRADMRALGFELIDLKKLVDGPSIAHGHDPCKSHRIKFFAIIFIEAGEFQHSVDFESHLLRAKDCLVISKDQVQAFKRGQDFEGALFLFTEQFLLQHVTPATMVKVDRLYDPHLQQPLLRDCAPAQEFIEMHRLELEACASEILPQVTAARLSILLLKLQANNVPYPAETEPGYPDFTAFRKLLKSDFRSKRNAKDYAAAMAISYKRLNEICKSFTGKTAKNLIDEYVTLEIKRYLSATTLSVKEICYECGFHEPTNFSKYFRLQTGMTPAQFRQSSR